MRLMRADNLHSRLVGWAKILLPLAALAVLATLFLVARRIDPSDAIPYAQVDVQERLREPRMTDASYSGVTNDGGAITLTAATAVPGQNGNAAATKLAAQLDAPDGSVARFSASTGLLDDAAGQILLSDGVTVDTSAGYQIKTKALQLALDQTRVEAPGQVFAEGPPGQITADSMVLNSAEATAGHYQLVFTGNVKLIYDPAK